jgi:hypothetical protein
MDFSVFEPLLALREEMINNLGAITRPDDKKPLEIVTKAAEQRDRLLTLTAKAKPAVDIRTILRAAVVPLPALTPTTGVPSRPRARAPRKRPK